MQRKQAVLLNLSIIGHFRYLFEVVGPELACTPLLAQGEATEPFSNERGVRAEI
jgi:hypothetical protein